jgi:hypothetical protein
MGIVMVRVGSSVKLGCKVAVSVGIGETVGVNEGGSAYVRLALGVGVMVPVWVIVGD